MLRKKQMGDDVTAGPVGGWCTLNRYSESI